MMHSDRLSELHDSLRIQIISLLEMKDVVRTGILSKSWKHLWTQTENAVYEFPLGDGLEKNMSIFEITDWKQQHLPQYLSFIDHTLLQCVSSIKKFSLTGFENIDCADRSVADFIDRWIAFLSTKNLESLNMSLKLYPIPDCLYTDFSSLTKLELYDVIIDVVSPVTWPLLKSLELGEVFLEDATIDNILMGCPMLETLVLNQFQGVNQLSVISPSVKRLYLYNTEYADDDVLKIRAPWVQELRIDGYFCVLNCWLDDLSSLSMAHISFLTYTCYESWIAMAIELLKAPLCRVGELIIGSELIQVLSMLKLLGKPSSSFMCKKVNICSPIWMYDLPGIQCLMENAHDLETLIITVDERKMDSPFPLPDLCALFENQDPHLRFPEARFEHLKNIKVDYSINPLNEPTPTTMFAHGVCFDFELLTYILRSAVALERLVIVISMIPSCFGTECLSSSCVYQYVQELSSKLLATSLAGTESAEWKLSKTKTRFEFRRLNRASSS